MSRAAKIAWLIVAIVVANVATAAFVWAQGARPATTPGVVAGVVMGPDGALDGARVRVHVTDNMTLTDEGGRFTLEVDDATTPVTVTAAAEGHYIDAAYAVLPGEAVTITLRAHYTTDNFEYGWSEADGLRGSETCAVCHTEAMMQEWEQDAHGQAAVNLRFLTLYQGTDVHGNKSPKTKTDFKGNVLPHDPGVTYYGPGFKLDYPDRAGNCATCHTPAAAKLENTTNCGWSGCHTSFTAEHAIEVPHGVSPLYLDGPAAEGISCEFCHKIGDVILDEETQLPLPDMPGILSYRLYRPNKGEDIFFGTLDDTPGDDVYLPLMAESEFCAGCHYGVFGGVVGVGEVTGGTLIYNSYGEWLDSPYSDAETGQTCQDCHMPGGAAEYFVYPEAGGMQRDPGQVHTHLMPGASDVNLLQNSATMTVTAEVDNGRLAVDVEVINDQTGHHLPTDAPIRSVMLVVQAKDADGAPLSLASGPTLPEWTGNYAGEPGRGYAKLLRDDWTGEMPTAAYWRPVTIVEDTRLAAMQTDVSRYEFEAPDGAATVDVQLIFRRAFQELAEQKGWDDPDILMEHATIEIAGAQETN